jgi:hypothetical protein
VERRTLTGLLPHRWFYPVLFVAMGAITSPVVMRSRDFSRDHGMRDPVIEFTWPAFATLISIWALAGVALMFWSGQMDPVIKAVRAAIPATVAVLALRDDATEKSLRELGWFHDTTKLLLIYVVAFDARGVAVYTRDGGVKMLGTANWDRVTAVQVGTRQTSRRPGLERLRIEVDGTSLQFGIEREPKFASSRGGLSTRELIDVANRALATRLT